MCNSSNVGGYWTSKGLPTPSESDTSLGWNALLCKGQPTPSKSENDFRSDQSESDKKATSLSPLLSLSLVWVDL